MRAEGKDSPFGANYSSTSFPDYADYRDKSRSFSSLDAFFFMPLEMTVVAGGRAERTEGQIATPGLLPALGVTMAAGRPFTADEGRDAKEAGR